MLYTPTTIYSSEESSNTQPHTSPPPYASAIARFIKPPQQLPPSYATTIRRIQYSPSNPSQANITQTANFFAHPARRRRLRKLLNNSRVTRPASAAIRQELPSATQHTATVTQKMSASPTNASFRAQEARSQAPKTTMPWTVKGLELNPDAAPYCPARFISPTMPQSLIMTK